jgi:Ca2+-binding RTX toxin-like protein
MRRRTVLVLTVMAAAILLASGVALAKNVRCPNRDHHLCVGTNRSDTMTGTNRSDTIEARGGDDTVFGRGRRDRLFGDGGDDHLDGGPGNDVLDGGPSPGINYEILCGGAGNDVSRESTGYDNYVFADGWGKDTISGPGDFPSGVSDTVDFSGDFGFCATAPVTADLTIDLGAGKAFETAAGENSANTVSWSPAVAGTQTTAGVSVIENAYGGSGNDTITGSTYFDYVSGGGGGDTIDVADNAFDVVDCGFDQTADTVTADSQDSVSSCDGTGDTVTRVP